MHALTEGKYPFQKRIKLATADFEQIIYIVDYFSITHSTRYFHTQTVLPATKHLFKVSSENIRMTPESVVLMLLLLTLSRCLAARYIVVFSRSCVILCSNIKLNIKNIYPGHQRFNSTVVNSKMFIFDMSSLFRSISKSIIIKNKDSRNRENPIHSNYYRK